MTDNVKPLLSLGEGRPSHRPAGSPQFISKPKGLTAAQQGQRLGPVFRDLAKAMDDERIQLSVDATTEMDPEHVLVLELASTVQDFRKAVEQISGLEFLAEYLGDSVDPDDNFFFEDTNGVRKTSKVQDTIYVVLSNARAAGNLVTLFNKWVVDHDQPFDRGLAKWKEAFVYLRSIRRWGVQDRVIETGLLDEWRQEVALAGQSISPIQVEIELWYRSNANARQAAQSTTEDLIRQCDGTVITTCEIPEIRYHAILADLPRQVAEKAVKQGAETIQLLVSDRVMFASPHLPMALDMPDSEGIPDAVASETAMPSGLPRIALLDGLPMGNHERLAGRLIIDDPDDLEPNYPVVQRHHGTAMASLIVHGDLGAGEEPLARPIYVRPIMEPREVINGEEVQRNTLITDLLHRAVRRIVEGDGNQPALAPSVRIINLSIGQPVRGTIRWMSSVGRLVDWLAVKYNLLFIVSAGNHDVSVAISSFAAVYHENLISEAFKWYVETSRQHGILPPGDAINALTVGASHRDASNGKTASALVLDPTEDGYPALFSATGPGIGRSIKPDLLFDGGKQVFLVPVFQPGQDLAVLEPARSQAVGPGQQVAFPGSNGDRIGFTVGTSNATALVTREASRLFDVLEELPDGSGYVKPDPFFHPVLVRALLIHAASWGDEVRKEVARRLDTIGQAKSRVNIGTLLGYGILDVERAESASPSRAVMLGWGRLKQDEETTFQVPLPTSLHAKADWHRISITLAYQAKTVGGRSRYRSARVTFDTPDKALTGGDVVEADSKAAKNGSVQHLVIEGRRAMTVTPETTIPIRIECRKDAQDLAESESIAYGLVVSIEAKAELSTTIFDEIKQALVIQAQTQARLQVRASQP